MAADQRRAESDRRRTLARRRTTCQAHRNLDTESDAALTPIGFNVHYHRVAAGSVTPSSHQARWFMVSNQEEEHSEIIVGPTPEAWSLSNGQYSVLLTSEGAGVSTFREMLLTRWSGDAVEDCEGLFLFLRDLDTRTVWSAGDRPLRSSVRASGTARRAPTASARCEWQPGRVTLRRRDHGIDLVLDVAVLPHQPAEIRDLTLVNSTDRPRRIEVTSYAEVVLSNADSYAAHPEFSKLFLQTRHLPDHHALLVERRPRSTEHTPCLVHALLNAPATDWETSRTEFVGRGAHPGAPRALASHEGLSRTTGNVLDPIVSLRTTVEIPAQGRANLTFAMGAAPSAPEAESLVEQLRQRDDLAACFRAAVDCERTTLAELGITNAKARSLQTLGCNVLYGHPGLRADDEVLLRAQGNLADLTRFGVSAQRRFAVIHIENDEDVARGSLLWKAHRYWQWHRMPLDILILDGRSTPADLSREHAEDGPRRVRTSDLAADELDMLHAAAHLVIRDGWLDLAALNQPRSSSTTNASGWQIRSATSRELWTDRGASAEDADVPVQGTWVENGSEYALTVRTDGPKPQLPPRPWVNVIANERFGFLVSETGASTTWSLNSRTHRLTPWRNDALLDPHTEALYVRDDDCGKFWSPLPGPCPLPGSYDVRHGFGFSRFRHDGDDLRHETVVFGSRDKSFKITALAVTNRGPSTRRLSLYAYFQLVLGASEKDSGRFVHTEFDPESGSIYARNRLGGEFATQVAFVTVLADAHAQSVHHTCDRATFLGRGSGPASPLALRSTSVLDGRTGVGLDPCVALQVVVELAPGQTARVHFVLGECESSDAVREVVSQLAAPGALDREWQHTRKFWDRTLSAIHIETPSRALDRIANGWLLYQTISCRLWGRTAFYQSGGAFGFRDQLQDVSALVLTQPETARRQILLHAAHQFVEGDVLHWWHPPNGGGIRTRFADDLLWLPYITATFIEKTGDRAVLDEIVPFLQARPLEAGEDEAYVHPAESGESASLYEHCCRALDRSLTRGSHGLPLFGTGDWNDGMNRVGREGRGESVWLAQFLFVTLGAFRRLCEGRGDAERDRRYGAYRESLRLAVDESWDGAWYRRGYYDDGAPLGSHENEECRIDALTQAWAVLSGIAPSHRGEKALESVMQHLVSEEEGLVRLLTPPFENTPRDPGYIRGYVAGVRENGGQYTHAAVWVAMAMARLGWNRRLAACLEMLSPVSHTATFQKTRRYGLEPYVMAADVYGAEPHVGRGGWSWYTGSSGWMLRAVVEELLGLRMVEGTTLEIAPCIPDDWPAFTLTVRLPPNDTVYEIHAVNPDGRAQAVIEARLDGEAMPVHAGICTAPVLSDGRPHRVDLRLGARGS